jgi:hypothetical protein
VNYGTVAYRYDATLSLNGRAETLVRDDVAKTWLWGSRIGSLL